jgi:ATP-dependent helicase/nuclease subunit A
MNLTPAQFTAINAHDRNLVVVAGAGSGKTFVLVERYLALLDAHHDWELNQLVAITFTQKAAQEMRDRVRQALLNRLTAAQAARDEASAALWSRRLNAMDSARIDTIHGLCTAILRQNAAEAGIDPGFQVLDETEAHFLLESTLDDLFLTLSRAEDPTVRLFREYSAYDIRRVLKEFISYSPAPPRDDLLRRWETEWTQDAQAHVHALLARADFRAAATWAPPGGFPQADDRLCDVWINCHNYLESLVHSDELAVRLSALRGLEHAINLQGGSPKVWGGKDILDDSKAALKTLRDLAKAVLADIGDPPGRADERAAESVMLWTALLSCARSAYGDAKSERSALDFDDLEALTCRLLENADIRARYRGREFKHVLVDEFQDTNAAQWQIVQSLSDPSVGGGLFLVGDPKQSIYAFRGADVRVFDEARQAVMSGGGAEITLARSFRAHAPLVACLNDLFGEVLTRDSDSPAAAYQVELGAPMDAARAQAPDDQPFLELLLIDKTELAGGDEDASEQARLQEAAQIAQRIRSMIESRTPVFDRTQNVARPAGYGDCALLFRSMTHVPIYEHVFKSQGLPFVTLAGRGYYDRQEVWDVLNLLRALHNPADDLALASALRSPLFALSDDALFALRLRRDAAGKQLALWDALSDATGVPEDEQARLRTARDTLEALRQLAGRVTIAELIEELLDTTHNLAVLTGLPDGARRRGNVEKLLDKARTSGRISLSEFARYLLELSQSETREGEVTLETEGAVVLMSVHKSKGLEFPVVFLVDASREGGGQPGIVLRDSDELVCQIYDEEEARVVSPFAYRRAKRLREAREEAELRRLLYVAATRAQDRLIISGQVRRRKQGGWSTSGWLMQLLRLYELGDWDGDGVRDFPWGQLAIHIVPAMAEPAEATAMLLPQREWQPPDPQAEAQMPPLLAPVRTARDAPARSLTATQIAYLGGFAADLARRGLYRERLLHSLLRDTPAHIDRVTHPADRIPKRKIGEIVHRALRGWKFPSPEDDLSDLLRRYAWEEGIVDESDIAHAIAEAQELLRRLRTSPVFTLVNEAKQAGKYYSELPFVFKTDKRIIYGQLDTLIQSPDGEWAVIDYKSGSVREAWKPGVLEDHARRYHLQVGVYAAAVQLQLGGITPAVYLHYIRYNHLIRVTTNEWQSALDSMEAIIGDAIG